MTDEQERRAVAWLDAHPDAEELATKANYDEARDALLAFLTSPLPCTTCHGRMWIVDTSWDPAPGTEPMRTRCPDCADGTAGILLDQLERGAR